MDGKKSIEEAVMHKFDVYIKKVIKNSSINYDLANKKSVKLLPLDENIYTAKCYELKESPTRYNIDGVECDVFDIELASAINKLPENIKAILLLSYFCDMSERQIAQKLNLSQTAINKQKNKALAIMREMLEDANE